MGNVISSKICKKCGECCKQSPFVELSTKELTSLEQFTGLDSELFTNSKNSGSDEYFLQFQENGACIFLKERDGGYACGVYEARPGPCISYPSKPIQNQFCEEFATL